jgi:putative restriction endonuclease
VLFDAGAIVIDNDLTVVRNGEEIGRLRMDRRHTIGLEYLASHRGRWRQ